MMGVGGPFFERRQAANGVVFVGGYAFGGKIRYGFFSAEGGVSHGIYKSLNCGLGSGDETASVERNRELCAEALGLATDRLAAVFQTHSADAITVLDGESAIREKIVHADGMATKIPELGLTILTADCLPLLLGDAESGVIGACHAGWRGAATGIVQATLSEMQAAGAKHITALIGPTIQQPSYQVGNEMRAKVIESQRMIGISADKVANCFIVDPKMNNRYLFDLPGFVTLQLDLAGVSHIANCGEDTFTPSSAESPQFFSNRRAIHAAASGFGRQISIISLAAPPK